MSECTDDHCPTLDEMDEEQLERELNQRGWRIRGETIYWGGGVTLPFRKDLRSNDPQPKTGSASGDDHAAAIRSFLKQIDAEADYS